MGGYSGGSSGGPSSKGTKKQAKTFSKKNEPTPVRDFFAGGGLTGLFVRSLAKEAKKAKDKKVNTSLLGTSDYQGDVNARKSRVNTRNYGNDNNKVASTKSIEQPKTNSQMDNTEVKSNLITAKGPTDIEMTDDEKLIARKRGRKTKTILTSVTGDNTKATLSKKVLLG